MIISLKQFVWRNANNLTNLALFYQVINRGKICDVIEYNCIQSTDCYDSKCVQKYNYHRFLVYNPKDYYYPFRVESFKLPSSCDCKAGGYHFHHEPHHHDKQYSTSTKDYEHPIYYGSADQEQKSSDNYESKSPIYLPPKVKKIVDEEKVPLYIDKSLG
jgi:hypothetical protein